MSLFKHPESPYWWVVFTLNGRKYRKSTGTTRRREAEQFERQWRTEIEQGEAASAATPAPLIPTLAIIRDWDVERARVENRSERYIKTGILQNWKSLIKHFERPDRVTEDTLLAFVKMRRAEGARGQTISKELTTLKRGMQRAKRQFGIAVPEEWPKISKDPKDEKRAGQFHGNATRQWLDELNGEAKDLATFAVLTGLRHAELYRTVPEWVRATPPGSAVPAVLEVPDWATKGRRARTVPLCKTALAIVLRAAPFKENHKQAFMYAARRVGIGNVSLRDLRKTFATIADSVVKDRTAVDMVMGHAAGMEAARNIPMLYQHATIARLAPIALALENWLNDGTLDTVEDKTEYREKRIQQTARRVEKIPY